MSKFQDVMKVIFGKANVVDGGIFQDMAKDKSSGEALKQEDITYYDKFGFFPNHINELVQSASQVNFERMNLYQQIDRAQNHWLVGAGLRLYADVATNYNQLHNASIWITSPNRDVEYKLMKLLEFVGMEERIYDLARNAGGYGDMFYEIFGTPGKGILSINDDYHPSSICRLDYAGRLVGFYKSEFDVGTQSGSGNQSPLLAPWSFVHFRLLGASRRRPNYFDPYFNEFRSVSMTTADTRKLSARFGASLINDSIPVYRRLRLAEDSLLLARLARTPLKYLYKLKVSGNNNPAIRSIVQQYTEILKKARAMDTGNAKFEETDNYLNALEDVILPITGEVGDLAVEKLGGEVDIKWIVDIEELRNQLSASMCVPLQMLGAYIGEAPGGLNTSALETVDIRFARASRRLQRSIIDGVTRMCQIHLAYLGENPDAKLFQVHMAETSTAEEQMLRESLDKGIDIVSRFSEMIIKNFGDSVDKTSLFNYLNSKILKLSDFELTSILKTDNGLDTMMDRVEMGVKRQELLERGKDPRMTERFIHNTDMFSYLPCGESVSPRRSLNEWNHKFGGKTVLFEKKRVEKS